jgi:hypothetical protein
VLQGDGNFEEGTILTAGALPGMNVVLQAVAEVLMRGTYAVGASPATANHVKLLYFAEPTDVVLCLVKSGQTANVADGLSADATGKFVIDATTPHVQALEATGGALAADTLIRVRVL